MTTCGAANDEKIGIVILGFQCWNCNRNISATCDVKKPAYVTRYVKSNVIAKFSGVYSHKNYLHLIEKRLQM